MSAAAPLLVASRLFFVWNLIGINPYGLFYLDLEQPPILELEAV